MKKIFQTIVDRGRGNCMQAVVASLLEVDLEDVPHFLAEAKDKNTNPNYLMWKFLQSKGYEYTIINPSKWKDGVRLLPTEQEIEFTKKCLRHDGGIGGYFYASVPSQTFDGIDHAVIIDSDMNIVHDPNPNQLALLLTKYDIIDIVVCKGGWYIDGKNGELIMNYTQTKDLCVSTPKA